MRYLLLLFIAMPVLEMWVLINVGSQIGALATIALVLLTALIGVGLLREQGLETLLRGRQKLQSGELPTGEIAEGLILAVSGALLLTPGFITDVLGFLGLAKPTRVILARKLLEKVILKGSHKSNFRATSQGSDGEKSINESRDIIDGESWEREDLE
jgi:UPF0716 protein FxsA